MIRFLLFLAVIAAVIWFGKWYMNQHPPASAEATPAAATPAPTPVHNIETCRQSIQALETSLLLPIESSGTFSQTGAEATLRQDQQELVSYARERDYARLNQACLVIGQALQERAGYLQRSKQTSDSTTLDKVPGNWMTKDLSLNGDNSTKNVDLSKRNLDDRNNLFKEAALRGWRERAEYYRPIIDRFVAQPVPGF